MFWGTLAVSCKVSTRFAMCWQMRSHVSNHMIHPPCQFPPYHICAEVPGIISLLICCLLRYIASLPLLPFQQCGITDNVNSSFGIYTCNWISKNHFKIPTHDAHCARQTVLPLVKEGCPSTYRGTFPLSRDVLNAEVKDICCSGCITSFTV